MQPRKARHCHGEQLLFFIMAINDRKPVDEGLGEAYLILIQWRGILSRVFSNNDNAMGSDHPACSIASASAPQGSSVCAMNVA